jgi:hypothetical protein
MANSTNIVFVEHSALKCPCPFRAEINDEITHELNREFKRSPAPPLATDTRTNTFPPIYAQYAFNIDLISMGQINSFIQIDTRIDDRIV